MDSLIERLRKRAEIRRSIPRGEPDRISDILEEAANEIERLTELYIFTRNAQEEQFDTEPEVIVGVDI
jgi:hypothetical protein